jgi:hypothetical protein
MPMYHAGMRQRRRPRGAVERDRARAAAVILAVLVFAPALAPALLGQGGTTLIDRIEDVDFDRPEAWAMKYFGSVALFTPLGPPRAREPGSIELGLEVTQVPHLSAEERTVGFNGIKEEDLNRLAVFVRPRVVFGLPHRFAVEVGYVPPVSIDGIEPNLLSLAVERELHAGERFTVGARLHGQIGEIEGDLTCSEEDASFPPGSPGNFFGCLEPSNDEAALDHIGLHLGAGYRLSGVGGSTLLFGAGVVHHDLEFQVDAFTYEVHDRSRLRADGTTWSLDAGISIPAAQKTQVGVEVLWSPLEVVRPPSTTAENDDLFHVKAVLRYRVR